MKLSDCKSGDVIKFPLGAKALVIERFPEDRSSGATKVLFFKEMDDAAIRSKMFYWDTDDIEVDLIGRGYEERRVKWAPLITKGREL